MNANSLSEQPRQNILVLFVAALLILVLFAMLTGTRKEDMETDSYVSGSIQKGKYVNNNWFAAEVCEVNRDIAREFNISPRTKGVIIVELEGNRDVLMKLRRGDVITGINNRDVHNLKDYRKAMQKINPIEGMFLDIQRNGYPMYVAVSGSDPASVRQPAGFQNPHPFSMTEVAPFLGRDINVGGMNVESGIIGKQIEQWFGSNFGSGFYACKKCGTLVPGNGNSRKKRIYCPNCGVGMVYKRN